MNEDFLNTLYQNLGGEKVGSFDEFKSEFQSNDEFQNTIYNNLGGSKIGSFDEFKSELFGNAQAPQAQKQNSPAPQIDVTSLTVANEMLKKNTAKLKAMPKMSGEASVQRPTTSGHGVLFQTEELFKPVKDKKAELDGNILTQAADYLTDVGAGITGLFKYNTLGGGYTVSQNERKRQKELEYQKLNKDKKELFKTLPVEGIPAVSIEDAVELELVSPKVTNGLLGQPVVAPPSAEEAHRKGTLRIKEHTELLKGLVETRKETLSKEELSIIDNMNSLDPEFLKSYQMSDNMKSYVLAQKNLNDQIGLNEQTFSKFDPLVEESYKAILNARQNGDDPEAAFNSVVDKFSSENPADAAAIKTIKDKVGKTFGIAEFSVGIPVLEQAQETAYGLSKTIGAVKDFAVDHFGALTRTFSTDSKFDKDSIRDLNTDEAKTKIRDIVVNNPNDASTSDLIEELVKVGDRTLVLKNGKVDKIRDKDGKQVYYPTKQDAQAVEQFGKNPEKYEKVKDVNFSAGWQQGVQVLTDMVPMIAAASATGGGSMGMMLGSAVVSYGDYYEQALAESGDISKAGLYAAATSGAIGYVESKIGKAEALLGRAFTGAEKSAIIQSIEQAAKKGASKGVLGARLEGGFMQKVKDVMTSSQPILKEIPSEIIEELTNFPVEGTTAALFDMPYEAPGEAEIINTVGLTMLATTIMGGLGGVASANKENMNSLISLGVTNRDGFKEVSDAWVQSAKDRGLPEAEITRRQQEVEKKSKLIDTVGKYYDFIKEESADRKMSDEKKNSIMDLAQEKALLDYKADGSTSTIRKDKIAADAAEVQKKLDKLVYSGTDIAEPIVDSDEDIKQKEEAAAQKKKDKEQKAQDNAIQEQETTEVPVQPETTSGGTNTQGQSQPESQGTAQQGKAQEQVQGEEVKTTVGDTQTTQPIPTATEAEKVAPTPTAGAQIESQQPAQVTPITKSATKLKKGADFSSDGTYEVTHNGEVIGKMYYDRERKLWSDPEYVPKDAYDIYGNNLGSKEEAIQEIVDRYNSKQVAAESKTAPTKEEIEQAVQKVDSTSINLLDEAISRAQKDLETETDPAQKEEIQQTINSLTKTRDQLINSQTNKQTKDENKESSQSNGQGQRQDEKRGQSQEDEVRGQGQKGNVTTNQQQTQEKLASDESKSKSNQDNKGQEGQGEGQVGSTLVEEQGKGEGEEVGDVVEGAVKLSPKYQRYVSRALATPSIPQEFKDALLKNAPLKVPVTYAQVEAFAKAVVDQLETLDDYVKAAGELVQQFAETITKVDTDPTVLNRGAWEITALKMIEKRVADNYGPTEAAKLHQRLANVGSILGQSLRQYGINDPSVMYVQTFGRHSVTESPIYDADTFEGSDVTHRDVANSLLDLYESAMQDEKDKLKAKIAAEIKAQSQKDKAKDTSSKTDADPNPDAKKAKTDLVKRLSDKADFYLNRFNSRLGEFSSGFDIEAIIDYTLYAYYKTAGSVVKTKRILEKRFGKETVDTNWDTISNSENFNKATLDIAQEKLLAAIGNAGQANEFTGTETSNRTPAQMIIQSITRQLQKKDRGPVSKKTIEEVITQKSMDIDTVSNLRRDINGGLLNVEADKRAEVLAQVDDLLAVLVKGQLDAVATPWVKKTLIRQKIKESADNLGVTVDQLIDDIANRATITNSISEEFLSRTGMSVEDAAPYIKIIEDSIESEINQKVKAKVEKLIVDSYGKNIIKLEEVVKTLEGAYKFDQDNLAAKKAELSDAVRNKTKSIEELREMQKGVKELQAKTAESKKKLQTYKTRLASGQKELKRKVSSKTFQRMPTVERVGFLVRNGGLSDETVFQAFAEVIGARNFTQADAETLRSLYERLDTSLFQIDKKEAAEAIAKFAFEIKSDVDKQIFVDILDSYAYSNMLGSMKTADVAISSGYGTFLYQEILSTAAQITKDVYALVTGKSSEFMNMKLMLDSFANMGNTRFSRAQFMNVVVGKDGISLPEINMQGEKSKQSGSRLEANMAYLDKVRALRDRAKKNGETAKAFGYNALIAHSIVSRMLIVADYVTTSTLLPYKVHRNLTDTSIKELTVEGLIHPSYNQVRERVKSKMKLDEVEAQLQSEGLAPTVMKAGKPVRSNAYNKRKAQILYEFIEESDKLALVQAEDSMRRIAFTGRISGMSGAAVEYLNRAFNTLSLIGDNKDTGKKNVGSMIVASLAKLATTPFAGATFRVIQFVKNSTPFGVLQIKDKANRKNAFDLVKLFDEYNYYNVYNGSVERVPATQFEKEVRWLMAMTPSIAAIAMFSIMFDYDEEDKVTLAEDTEWIFTSAYSPAMARKLGLTESTYEPYTAYRRNDDGTFDRQFAYKDMPYLWFLASVGRLQEKLIFDQEESLPTGQTPETKVKDPLASVDAYLAAIRSALAFSTQGSISSAGGAITAGTELIEGGVPDPFQLKKTGQGLLRQFIPFSALQAEADNYNSLLTQAARRKGVTAVGDVVDKMIMSKPFIDNYEFDVLGENVVQRPYGPLVTTITTMAVEGLGHAMKGDVELKYPNARKVLTRFMDIDKIKKLYFGNIGPESYKATTVWAPEDPQIHHDLSRDAADLKGQAIEEDYENLMSLPKMEFEKKLKKINDDSNESVKIRYAIDKLSYMYEEEMLVEKIKSTKELNEFMVEQSIYIDPEGNIKDFDYLANYEK